jgi:hypothetical protein
MQPATILTILGLAVFTIANPVLNPEVFGVEGSAEARGLEGMPRHHPYTLNPY